MIRADGGERGPAAVGPHDQEHDPHDHEEHIVTTSSSTAKTGEKSSATTTTSGDAQKVDTSTPTAATEKGVQPGGAAVDDVPAQPLHIPVDKVVDVVAVPSLRADGTPDQTSGFQQYVPAEKDPREYADQSAPVTDPTVQPAPEDQG